MGISVTSGDDDDVTRQNSRLSRDCSEQCKENCVLNLSNSTNLNGVVNINRPIVTLVRFLFFCVVLHVSIIFVFTISGTILFCTGKQEEKYSFKG